ncbi:MAG TPA: DPP IV N-terminal domain-containing protein [Chloroflexia bacterium]
MNIRQSNRARLSLAAASALVAGSVLASAIPAPAAAVDFAHPAFKRLWDRTDSLVSSLQVSRTFFWGPEPRAAAQEQYVDAPSGTGTRLVQYFDKSRMEINNPGADPNAVFFVTNGLLTIELISGQMQVGNNSFVERYPANIPISGDVDDTSGPTYATFIAVANTRRGDHPQPDRTNQFATATINRAGQIAEDPSKANNPAAKITHYEPSTKHNIPEAFWAFLNATGPVSQTGQIVNQRLIDPWFYASGLPISDPYWSKVKIRGELTDVLIQAFERRVLTYVPTNPAGFQVEMGNIGLHYYDWRYKDAGKPPAGSATVTGVVTGTVTSTVTVTGTAGTATVTVTATGTPGTPTATVTGTPPTATPTVTPTPNVVSAGRIAFTSRRTGNKDIWRINGDGTAPINLTNNPADEDDAAYSPDGSKIAFSSTRDAGDQEIYVMNNDGSNPVRLTNSPGQDFSPSWSPDGSRIVFVSRRNNLAEDLYVMNANGTGQINITQAPGKDLDPSWGANGRIVFSSDRSGTTQIYTINPDGTGIFGPLTTTTQDNDQPEWNRVANRIVFRSFRDGHGEIYTMRQGGEEQFRVTNTDAGVTNSDPTYAPDNSRIAFTSNRVAEDNYELYTMGITGQNQERITIQTGNDTHPSWSVPGAFINP